VAALKSGNIGRQKTYGTFAAQREQWFKEKLGLIMFLARSGNSISAVLQKNEKSLDNRKYLGYNASYTVGNERI
jgi:hypothetical protein